MPRRSPIALTALEAREVPAAGPFADIMPGAWGSYPHDFTTSGKTLFFAADNGHGDEVYASDGTAAGTHMVKDLSPGKRGSDPSGLVAAGNGVVFFTADDGTGRALYRSDGTAAGTLKVPGVPATAAFGLRAEWLTGGGDGSVYFTSSSTNGPSNEIWRTDGTTTARLAVAEGTVGNPPYLRDGKVYFAFNIPTTAGIDLWVAGPTGAERVYQHGSAGSEGVLESPFAELAPGKWLVGGVRSSNYVGELSVRDGTGQAVLLRTFEPLRAPDGLIVNPSVHFSSLGNTPVVGGKVFFTVQNYAENPVLWSTDGTAAGTKPVGGAATFGNGWIQWAPFATFGDRGLSMLSYPDNTTGATLIDGATANPTLILDPDGNPVRSRNDNFVPGGYLGRLPTSAAYPDGLLVFRTQDRVFVTDGTPGGAKWVDTAGLSAAKLQPWSRDTGPVLNGSVYFAGPRTADSRPEPWKFDLVPAPVTPPVKQPLAATVTVNGGDRQRSTVTKITVAFDRAVLLTPEAFELRNTATGKLVPLTMTRPKPGGATVLDFSFTGLPGGLADGTYTFTVRAAKVTAIGGGTLAADSVTTVTRLFGDLDGDGLYDRSSRWMLHERLGAKRGDAKYLAAFDVDGDGTIGAADELAVVRNWSKQFRWDV